jgi:rhomboid protease GluP
MLRRYNETVEKRRMCPNCRAFINMSDRVCPYCGVQLGPRVADLRGSQVASSFLPRLTTTSMIVLIINVVWYILEIVMGWATGHGLQLDNVSIDLGLSWGPYVLVGGQWWRLVTAGFLHGGIFHLLMNSYALIILVTEVEQFYGTNRFIVAYIFSTICGFLSSCLIHPRTPSLGASAAAYGLIGIMLAMTVGRRTHPLAHLVKAQYSQWLIFGIILSVMPGGRIDLAAHIGGFAGGFVIGLIAGLPSLPGSPRENFWRIAAGFTLALTLYCFYKDFIFVTTHRGLL